MNRSALKTYAPQARRDFIQAMTDRAAFFGITAKTVEPVLVKGDAAVISGKEYPKAVAGKRKLLEERIQKDGFHQTMEAVAYTWFNRFVALRYMELHQYLEHGYRVLSHPDGKETPEILEHAQHLDFAGLNRELVVELKLDGNKENQLYRLILIAQCNALHEAMPFLFERIDDETELLLPENLLNSDSLVRKLVNGIEESDWEKVEILGWLYQFYISEKKDEVIGKVVASEDIPAATQLFTPNWIVRYLVQNTLGRQWLATYPDSPIRAQMEFYIEPANQEPEVQEQLKAITPTSLNPEEITFLDPAAGSGHILVEAYDLFKAIYLERGYRSKDIPALILQKNLFGLEIDDRASQLAAFALMMKAREDDRRIFECDAKPNVLAFKESKGLDAAVITSALNYPINGQGETKEFLFEEIEEEEAGLFSKKNLAEKRQILGSDIASLIELFENAKTFGSLIQIPFKLASKLPEIENRLDYVMRNGDLAHGPAKDLKPLLQQGAMLSRQYDLVVANPPYMGIKNYTKLLKLYINSKYKKEKADLYSCFMERNYIFCKINSFHGMINIPNWMFLSSFEEMRKSIFENQTIDTFIHNGRGVFGSDFGSCAFVFRKCCLPKSRGSYRRLFEKSGSVSGNEELENRFHIAKTYTPINADFGKIPGSPIAYWTSEDFRLAFEKGIPLGEFGESQPGLQTSDNARFVRFWHEVSLTKIGFSCKSNYEAKQSLKKWFPFNKGGEYRRWYGNNYNVVNWEKDGEEIKEYIKAKYPYLNENIDYVVKDRGRYFKPSITWTVISSSFFGIRCSDEGFLFADVGAAIFPPQDWHFCVAGFMASVVAAYMLAALNPTVHFQVGNIQTLPFLTNKLEKSINEININVIKAIKIARTDWDLFEISWDFKKPLQLNYRCSKIKDAKIESDKKVLGNIKEMKFLELENNKIFINYYGLTSELSPEPPDDQITLHRPNREEDIKRLISYAIGCTMGRYSLDKEGLIYANANNEGFDPTQYKTFPADDDGIVPLLNQDWGIRDDATDRFVKFISVAWAEEHLEENLKFVSESIGGSPEDNPREIIRNYFSTGFYKFHLQMYKRRPIYWLFSSGKQKAFQALVYLHRYNEGTLSRMRTEYVIPLQGKISGRIEQLEGDKLKATSTSHRKKLQKEQDDLKKQQKELLDFDEKLKHYADQRIKFDLDDGVKVNYGKFGDLLAEVKAVTGGGED